MSARKAKHLDVTTMFTYSHANTPHGQSERVYYLTYFIKTTQLEEEAKKIPFASEYFLYSKKQTKKSNWYYEPN